MYDYAQKNIACSFYLWYLCTELHISSFSSNYVNRILSSGLKDILIEVSFKILACVLQRKFKSGFTVFIIPKVKNNICVCISLRLRNVRNVVKICFQAVLKGNLTISLKKLGVYVEKIKVSWRLPKQMDPYAKF